MSKVKELASMFEASIEAKRFSLFPTDSTVLQKKENNNMISDFKDDSLSPQIQESKPETLNRRQDENSTFICNSVSEKLNSNIKEKDGKIRRYFSFALKNRPKISQRKGSLSESMIRSVPQENPNSQRIQSVFYVHNEFSTSDETRSTSNSSISDIETRRPSQSSLIDDISDDQYETIDDISIKHSESKSDCCSIDDCIPNSKLVPSESDSVDILYSDFETDPNDEYQLKTVEILTIPEMMKLSEDKEKIYPIICNNDFEMNDLYKNIYCFEAIHSISNQPKLRVSYFGITEQVVSNLKIVNKVIKRLSRNFDGDPEIFDPASNPPIDKTLQEDNLCEYSNCYEEVIDSGNIRNETQDINHYIVESSDENYQKFRELKKIPHFVVPEVNMLTHPKTAVHMRKELNDIEVNYINALKKLLQYRKNMKFSPNSSQGLAIFGNIKEIYKRTQTFYDHLNQLTNINAIIDLFHQSETIFDLYIEYATNFPYAKTILYELKDEIEILSKLLNDNIDLECRLSLPFKHLGHYILLFKKIKKTLDKKDLTSPKLENVINMLVRKTKLSNDSQTLSLIKCCQPELIKGQFLGKNSFEMIEPLEFSTTLFAMSDVLVITHEMTNTGYYLYVGHIFSKDLKVYASHSGRDIAILDQSKKLRCNPKPLPYRLLAHNIETKKEWLKIFRKMQESISKPDGMVYYDRD